MQTDILLKQINERIQELKGQLNDFEGVIHPDSDMADRLNDELQKLVRLLGAYTFIRQQQELSPQLNLHMKVAEKTQPVVKESIVAETVSEPVKQEPMKQEPVIEPVKTVAAEPQKEIAETGVPGRQTVSQIQISINDKFRLINELFKSNAVEYGIAVEQINAIGNWTDTQIYLTGLKNIYGWDEEHEMVKKIFDLSKKRFQ